MPHRKILVVEEDESIRAAVGYCLRRYGYTVLLAKNAPDALARVQEKDISLIILDPTLHRLDGGGLLAHLQAGRQSAPVPAIILTAFEDDAYQQRCFALGARRFIIQPFSPRELVAAVREVLGAPGSNRDPGREVNL